MALIPSSTIQFLKDLKVNNDRDWFASNKARYEEAKTRFEHFIDALINRIGDFDRSISHHTAKDCVFRIYRDVRFSNDKSPYKTHFGAHITPAASRSEIHTRAGYYVHIEPGASILAGGAYLPQGNWLKGLRADIMQDATSLRKILNDPAFKKVFGDMEGEKLKTAPRGIDKEHPDIDLLRHKSFLAVHHCDDELIASTDFLDHATGVFRTLMPFDRWLNRSAPGK